MKYYAGLNFDNSFIQCSIIARDGTLLCRDRIQKNNAQEVPGTMSHMVLMLKQRANVDLAGIGIVLPEMAACLGTDGSGAERMMQEMQTELNAPVVFINEFNVNDFDSSAFGEL